MSIIAIRKLKKMIKNKKHNNIKNIAIFGGSFNPPHEGHFTMAKNISDSLKVDEVWFLFSTNRFKSPEIYAPVEDRVAMGEIMAKRYTDYNFVMKDIEDKVGSNLTFEVMRYLKKEYPDCHFIWVMGADNLAEFEKWDNFDEIIQTNPIAVVDRPGYTEKALTSYCALIYSHLQVEEPNRLANMNCGWCFLENPQVEISSTWVRDGLKEGKRHFEGEDPQVIDYIIKNKLYGTR